MPADGLTTKCAPPQRLAPQEVDTERNKLSGHSCSGYFDFFPIPLIVLNECRQIVLGNKAFLDILGITELHGFAGKRPGEAMDCIYAHVEAAGCGTSAFCRECGALQAILETMANNSRAQRDCQLLVKKGNEVSAKDLRIFTAPWNVEGATYYVASIIDVGDEKRRKILERIFFHDILNAAGGAKGLVDLLMDEVPESAKEMVSLAQASLFGLVEEIKKQKQLLALETKEYTLSMITLQGFEIIQLVAKEYRTHPAAVGKDIRIAPDSINVPVFSDFSLLKRVLVNMTLNALEATEEGGAITIGLSDNEQTATFWVQNSKIIAESVKAQIFKRSFSTKGKDRGLGTYSIKLLTENYLGGTVGFTSTAAAGTIFWADIKKA